MSAPFPPFAFVSEPLLRTAHWRDDANAMVQLRAHGRCVWLDDAGHAQIDAHGALHNSRPVPEQAIFLGLDKHADAWFAARLDSPLAEQRRIGLRQAALLLPAFESTLLAQAQALLHWRDSHRHCPACGGLLVFSHAGWQGGCPGCGRVEYPRTDPAIIVAVSDGQRLLLGRQPGWPARRYSTLAGFVEPGETLEQALRREVFEESRVRIKDCHYLASQPWPFPGALMLGFLATAWPDVPEVAQDELEDAQWFDATAIEAALLADPDDPDVPLRLPPPSSISRWLIAQWFAQLNRDCPADNRQVPATPDAR